MSASGPWCPTDSNEAPRDLFTLSLPPALKPSHCEEQDDTRSPTVSSWVSTPRVPVENPKEEEVKRLLSTWEEFGMLWISQGWSTWPPCTGTVTAPPKPHAAASLQERDSIARRSPEQMLSRQNNRCLLHLWVEEKTFQDIVLGLSHNQPLLTNTEMQHFFQFLWNI